MKFLGQTLLIFFSLITLIALSIAVSYLLPYPFSKINIVFFFLIIVMMSRDSGLVVWISFFTHFFIELYSSTPFGLILFSGTISILIIFWLYKNIFTNRSWYSAMTLLFVVLLVYRLLYILILMVLRWLDLTTIILEKNILLIFGWEILLTCLLTGLFYFILSHFFKSFKASPIEHGLFRV